MVKTFQSGTEVLAADSALRRCTTLEAYAQMLFDAFLARNVAALSLDSQGVRAEAVTLDMKLLPRKKRRAEKRRGGGRRSKTFIKSVW
jgi:hypothetical protein